MSIFDSDIIDELKSLPKGKNHEDSQDVAALAIAVPTVPMMPVVRPAVPTPLEAYSFSLSLYTILSSPFSWCV